MAHKLLLADDSVTIQRVIELTFADEDIDVTTVGDGQLAIDRLDTDPPDIVLADVDMPKRDGYEVAAYVKSRPKLAHIPVVLLTGAFEPIDQARATAAGSSDVLAKPFEPQMVINRVKELLGRKRPDEDGAYVPGDAERLQETPANPPSATRPPAGEGPEAVSLDDYFDQLDAAFSNLQPAAHQADGAEEVDWPPMETVAASVPTQPVVDTPAARPAPAMPVPAMPAFTMDPIVSKPVPPPAPVAPVGPVALGATIAPVAPVAPVAAAPVVPAPPAPIAPSAPVAPVAPSAPVTSVAPPAPFAPVAPAAAAAPIAPDAPIAPIAPVPPAPAKPPANPFANLSAAKAEAAARPPAPVITDDLIEEIVSRVMQRMTDRVVRETVTDIVSQTAERLVQEEIERIKTGS